MPEVVIMSAREMLRALSKTSKATTICNVIADHLNEGIRITEAQSVALSESVQCVTHRFEHPHVICPVHFDVPLHNEVLRDVLAIATWLNTCHQ